MKLLEKEIPYTEFKVLIESVIKTVLKYNRKIPVRGLFYDEVV